jgi:hypothetical protein
MFASKVEKPIRARTSARLLSSALMERWSPSSSIDKGRRHYLRESLILLGVLVTLLVFRKCSGVVERDWSEEVALDDGRIVAIDRYVKFSTSNSLAGDAFSSKDLESELSFRGQLSSLTSWNFSFVPLVLYQDRPSGEWVIVASTSNCDTLRENGNPQLPYWEFRLKGNKWSRAELSPTSMGRKTNLFFDYEPSLPVRKITPVIKEYQISIHHYGTDYLSIDPKADSNCN